MKLLRQVFRIVARSPQTKIFHLLPLRRERKKMMMTRERKTIVTNPLLQHLIHWLIQKGKKEDGDTYSGGCEKGKRGRKKR